LNWSKEGGENASLSREKTEDNLKSTIGRGKKLAGKKEQKARRGENPSRVEPSKKVSVLLGK